MRFCGILCETGEPATVTVAGTLIESVTPGVSEAAIGRPDVLISPGMFDLQLNGYGGIDFNLGIWESDALAQDTLIPLFHRVAASGTSLMLPTVVTNSAEAMSASLHAIAALLDSNSELAAMVPGVHVEGPYLSSEDGPRGAHPLQHIRNPSIEEYRRFQDSSGGRVKLFTLAPERPGALTFIEKLASEGIVVAIGHTGASPEVIRDAVSAGARMSTHLGNGAHSVLPRHPNYIWEQLASDELYASLITDGNHLPASVVKTMVRAKGKHRTAIVSDAVALGGLPPGLYSNGMHEVLPGGKIVLAGTPYLAGAGHLLDTCVANATRFSDLTIAQAAISASRVPVEILGLQNTKGKIAPGYDADLTLFRFPNAGPLEILMTVTAGSIRFRAGESGSQ